MSAVDRRINFRFSGRGHHLACLSGHGRLLPELWDLTTPAPRLLRTREGQTPMTVPIPTGDGRVLLAHVGTDGVHRLRLITPDGEYDLGHVHGDGFALLAGPAQGTPALAFATSAGRTTVSRLSGNPEPPEPVTVLSTPIGGGIWLDEDGTRLAVRSQTGTAVLDLTSGTLTPLPGAREGERLLRAAPRTGVMITAAPGDEGHRLGVRRDA
jgi:hypothetical protein